MGYYSIKFAIIALCVNLAWSLPSKFEKSDVNENNIMTKKEEKEIQDTQNLSVDGIFNEILSTTETDTDSEKEAKKLVAQNLQHLVKFVSSLKPTPSITGNSKFSKVEKNYFTPEEEAIIMKRIMNAVTESKIEDKNTDSVVVNKPLKLEASPETETNNITLHSNTTEEHRIESSTENASEINSTEPVWVYPPTVRDMIEDFITNIRKRNFTGVVEIGLKLATFQTIGQGLREAVNRALLNALHRYLLLNFQLNRLTQRLRNPQISFIDAFRFRRSDLMAEDKKDTSSYYGLPVLNN